MKFGAETAVIFWLSALAACGDVSDRDGRKDAGSNQGKDAAGVQDAAGRTDSSFPADAEVVPPTDAELPADAGTVERNHPPLIEPIEDVSVPAGAVVTFRVKARDPDMDVIAIRAEGLPDGAEFNTGTAVFHWVTAAIDVGDHEVAFIASDGELDAREDVTIEVSREDVPISDAGVPPADAGWPAQDAGTAPVDGGTVQDAGDAGAAASDSGDAQENHPPQIELPADFEETAGRMVTFRVRVSDTDGDLVALSCSAMPEGAGFNALTAVFSWVPQLQQVGAHAVIFKADDGEASIEKSITITVIEPEGVEECPSGVVCNGACCDAGLLCLEGACQAPGLECGQLDPCGAICCAAAEVCFNGACTAPGAECASSLDCPLDEYCEPLLGRCLSRGIPGEQCEYRPPVGQFDPFMECAWRGSAVKPKRDDVVMTPAVANLTDDNGDGVIDTKDIPDVVFQSYDLEGDGCCHVPATLRVVSGKCRDDGSMDEILSVSDPVLDNSAGVAVGDLEGDGSPDIVAMIRGGGTVAFERNGAIKWQSPDPTGNDRLTSVQPAIANLDGEGPAEVIAGRVALDGATGQTLWKGQGGRGINSFLGPISIASDVNLDGFLEVIAGNTLYDHAGNILWTYAYGNEGSGCGGNMPCDGFNAAGNFDADDEGEIVTVREGSLYVIEHDGTLKKRIAMPKKNCAYNEGGPPTVADFDGDGRAEIGVAGADYYSVFDLDCTAPLPAGCRSEGVLWSVPNNDCSSRATGSSVFDFEGDGVAEVIYNDEQHFRIFRGYDGAVLFEWHNNSHTRLEYPVIVDADNDGNAEIVFIENRYGGGSESGIEIWGDRSDNWVCTRRIWNQHTYHVTNIEENGQVPLHEEPNWLVEGLNNFRQNVQREGLFNAPDLVIADLAADLSECNTALVLLARVANMGSRGVPAGLKVSFYMKAEGRDEELLGTIATARDLLPGGSEDLVFRWTIPQDLAAELVDFRASADDTGDGSGRFNECIEDNNDEVLDETGCSLNCPPGVTVPSPESCNDADDDCDGETDEGLARGCARECGGGTEFCDEGEWVGCTAPAAEPEVCDGFDNDCDGTIDEGVLNRCGFCGDEPREVCDDADNDCDGETDEGLLRDCFSACGRGQEQCEHGAWMWCSAVEPEPESCNGFDDDCDGRIDDGLSRACATACGTGEERCEAGRWLACNAVQPEDEVCDGFDNDCDGAIDEGVRNRCGGCGPESAESCNGFDDDCDGTIDDGASCRNDEVCYCGGCAPRCIRGECFNGAECRNNICGIDRCPAGTSCAGGACVGR